MRATIVCVLNLLLKLKRMLRVLCNFLLPMADISFNYVSLQREEADKEGQRLRNSWQDIALPQRQRELVDYQLYQYRSGARIEVFDVFVDSLRAIPDLKGMTLLEVGCSSGYYSEVIEIARLPIKYYGCDYSEAFICLAKEKYPFIEFAIEDATAMNYPESSFDIVVSGCCLLHIPEYKKAIAETVRVARRYAIFHRTPIVWGQAERWYRKQAYGVETLEIHFNESEFLARVKKMGLKLISTYTFNKGSVDASSAKGHAIRTYIFRKMK